MGVYVRNLEMPVTCCECIFSGDVQELGVEGGLYKKIAKCLLADSIGIEDPWRESRWQLSNREAWCPLTEVKVPHGRLVDASDGATYAARFDHFDDLHMIASQNAIDDLPTVIEEERKSDLEDET